MAYNAMINYPVSEPRRISLEDEQLNVGEIVETTVTAAREQLDYNAEVLNRYLEEQPLNENLWWLENPVERERRNRQHQWNRPFERPFQISWGAVFHIAGFILISFMIFKTCTLD